MRIGLAHHDREVLKFLKKCIEKHGTCSVVWTAQKGPEALIQIQKSQADVVLLDIHLPTIDGVEVTRQMMEKASCHIIIMTSNIEKDSSAIFKAMRFGAVDTMEMPVNDISFVASEEQLIKKIRKASILRNSGSLKKDQPLSVQNVKPPKELRFAKIRRYKNVKPLIIIGSSTGGPKALLKVISRLPGQLPAPIVIIQHVLEEFSADLVSWLAKQVALKVELAREGSTLEIGTVYVASTNDHMILTPELKFTYTSEPKSIPFRPSVDVFFHSAAENWPDRGLAVILTGMGNDGAKGMAELRNMGWHTIAQDEATSSVYGMPKAAVQMNAAVEVLPVEEIGRAIIAFIAKQETERITT